MAIPNAEHLFEQAERAVAAGLGAPRQTDLRRAVSNAYYGVFHAVLAAAADHFVGATKRDTKAYGLVYRSVDHRALRDLCLEVKKPTLTARYARYQPEKGFGEHLQAFAAAYSELYEKRHSADYDPLVRIRRADVVAAIDTARSALRRFAGASARRRTAFLTLLLFPPR